MTDAALAHVAIPGPLDRESFEDAQARHRRAAGLYGVLVILALLLVGLPLAGILFPLLFGLATLASDLLSLVGPAPDPLGLLLGTGGHFGEGEHWLREWLLFGLVVCTPGAVAMLLLWRAIWAVFLSAGTLGVLGRLGARPARPGDLEERQLVNLVEEMAIAAGLPAPAVLLLDSAAINAAALGPSLERSTILVTRGLLDQCDRDETQGVIAHLIATIGNGDQRLALRLIASFATLGLVRQLLKAPLSPSARQLLAELGRFAWRGAAAAEPAAAARLIEALLAEEQGHDLDQADQNKIKAVLLLPFMMAFAMFNLVAFLASLLFLSPALALLLRHRRYLADATAVQLTRNPDGLAQALQHLVAQPDQALACGQEASLLFITEPRSAGGSGSAPIGLMFKIHPAAAKRHARLVAMGATGAARGPNEAPEPALPARGKLLAGLLTALLVPLIGLLIYLMLFLIVAGTGLALIVGMMWVLILLGPLHVLLR